jgi:CheY-like chemotaxis protein
MAELPRQSRVLVVDDEPLCHELIKRELVPHGCEVFSAYNGDDALEMIQKEHYDLMILDLKMPRGNALFVLNELSRRNIQMRTVVLTGFNDGPEFRALKEAFPVVTIISKPLTRENATILLQQLMEHLDGV